MNLNNLRDEAFKIACDHGFHDTELSNEHCLMLVITELSEAVEADRKDKQSNYAQFKLSVNSQSITTDEMWKEAFEKYIKDSVGDELADATIRILDLAGLRKVDIEISDDTYNDFIKYSKLGRKNQYNFVERIFHICKSMIDEYVCDNIENVILTLIILIKIACHAYDIDLEWHIKMKMEYNSMRENKHGKKY